MIYMELTDLNKKKMKNQPSEEEKTQYEFRCHQCGEVFMDDIFGYEYPLTPLMLASPKNVRIVEASESCLYCLGIMSPR